MNAFQGRFKSNKEIHVESWDAQFPRLDRMDTDHLEALFIEEEVHQELMGADRNKAPGSDGFSFIFAQSFGQN